MSANASSTFPAAVRSSAPAARTSRSKLRRLYVRIRRKMRPAFEVAAFFGAAVSAILELFSGRLPSFSAGEVSCPPEPQLPATADSPFAPYPVHD